MGPPYGTAVYFRKRVFEGRVYLEIAESRRVRQKVICALERGGPQESDSCVRWDLTVTRRISGDGEATEFFGRRGPPIAIAGCVRRPTVNHPALSLGSRGRKRGRRGSPRVSRNITNSLLGWSAPLVPTVAARWERATQEDTSMSWWAHSTTPKNGRSNCTGSSIAKSAPQNQEIAFQCPDRPCICPRQPVVLPDSASRRHHPGNFGLVIS